MKSIDDLVYNAKQDPVVYGAAFGVVFLAKGPRTASIQMGIDCFGFYHSGLEGERYFRLVVKLRRFHLMRIQHTRARLAILTEIMSGLSVIVPPR